MNFTRRQFVKSSFALPLASALPRSSFAQVSDYPSREIHSISMLPAGSGADTLVRHYSRKLEQSAGKPVIVEIKMGAAGNIAMEYFARSKPDGYTVFLGPVSSVIAPARYLFKNLNYAPEKDVQSVALLSASPFALHVPGDSPAKSVTELVDYLKKKGNKASYGSSTATGQVCAEVFKAQFGLDTVEVKYRSGLEGLNELSKNQLDFYFTDVGTTKGMVADGKLRALMVTTTRRWNTLPDLPGTAESGLTNLDLFAWFSAHVPAGTPAPIVAKLKGWIDQFAASDETRKLLADLTGGEPLLGDTKAVDGLMEKERAKWAEFARIAKIEPQ